MKKLSILLVLTVIRSALAMNSSNSGPEALLACLTLEQKIAQLFMMPVVVDEDANAAFMANSPYKMDLAHVLKTIERYDIGSIIILGKGTSHKVKSCIDQLQGVAKTPLLVGIDAEWGLNMRIEDAMRFPRAMTLGALPSKQNPLIRKVAQLIGISCRELGIGINFAPVVDVNNNPKNPIIGMRSFGEGPDLVACKATYFAQGLADAGVLACAKHFPGHGDTQTDSHVTLPTIPHDRSHLAAVELRPFRELIAQRIPAIMTAHLLVPALDADTPSSASHNIVTGLLQGELEFTGLIITDGLGMGALLERYKPGEIERNALLAGNDMLLGVLNVPHAINLIKQAIQDSEITENEINRRVLKVLKAKQYMAIERKPIKELPFPDSLKKEIYLNAITLVKNSADVLPLEENALIDIRTYGTSPSAKFGETLDQHLPKTKEAAVSVVMVVFPFAQKRMIDETPSAQHADAPLSLADEMIGLRKRYKRIIAVLCDSPYRIAEIESADAIICAYEDDPDAQNGAALALLGYYNPNGKLPVTISSSFPAGIGLSYTARP